MRGPLPAGRNAGADGVLAASRRPDEVGAKRRVNPSDLERPDAGNAGMSFARKTVAIFASAGVLAVAAITGFAGSAMSAGADAPMLSALLAGTLLAVLAGAGLAVRALVVAPITRLADALEADAASPDAERADEVGRIARACLRRGAKAAERARSEGQDIASRLQAEVAAANKARNSNALAHAEALQKIGEALRALAAGDLSVRLGESLAGEAAPIAARFDQAVTLFAKAILAFATSAGAIRAKSHDISEGAEKLARRGDQRAGHLEQVMRALDAEAARGETIAEASSRARLTLAALGESAAANVPAARRGAKTLETIAQSGERIGEIATLIDEVAFQISLLALNAGVEAARAGEAGRGIAVVAQEMRALALRSTSAAKDLGALLSQTVGQARLSADEMHGACASLERMVVERAQWERTTAAADTASTAPRGELEHIRGGLQRISDAMRADGAFADAAVETGRSLDELLSKLSGLIEHFQFDRSGLRFEQADRAMATRRALTAPLASQDDDEPARPLLPGRRRANAAGG